MTYAELCETERPKLPENLVPHPRYGSKPRRSRGRIPATARSHRRHRSGKCFSETAIPADPSKQHIVGYGFPAEFYVDTLEKCSDCGRPFIFFAIEQRHWYEDLGFGQHSWCIQCVPCRKKDHRFNRYSSAVVRADLAPRRLVTLIRDAIFLWQNNLLHNRDKLNRIRKLARTRLPNHAATREIEEFTRRLDEEATG